MDSNLSQSGSNALRTKAEISQHLRNVLLEKHDRKRNYSAEDNETMCPIPAKKQKELNNDDDISGGGESNSSRNATEQTPSPRYSEDEDFADEEDNNTEVNNESNSHPIYLQGTKVFENDLYSVFVKGVQHKRRTRYSLSDHLFIMWIEPKKSGTPLIFDLESALETALTHVLDRLKRVYDSVQNQNQIYITVTEKNILHGLNSGNYSLHTPSAKIVRWVLSMLYNYLKSEQTLRLNDSFKIQIKVLSHRHVQDLEKRRADFKKHIYH